MWTLTVSIVAIAWVAVLLWIVADVVRRPDLGMAGTLAWAIVLIVLPLIGGLAYLITDVVRRDELSSGERVLWVVLLLVLPIVGMVTYMVASRAARAGRRPPGPPAIA
jgi:hypothetical protein